MTTCDWQYLGSRVEPYFDDVNGDVFDDVDVVMTIELYACICT